MGIGLDFVPTTWAIVLTLIGFLVGMIGGVRLINLGSHPGRPMPPRG